MAAEFDQVASRVKELAQDPEGLVDHLGNETESTNSNLPNISQAYTALATKGLGFLNSKLPQKDPQYPLSPEPEASPQQKNSFMKYYKVVHDPISALDHMHEGSLSPEHIEALQAVHPELYQHIQSGITNMLLAKPELGEKLSYQKKQSLSLFLGHPLDPSFSPQAVQANQAALSGEQLSKQNAAPSSSVAHGSMKELDLAANTTTGTQRREAGQDE